MTTRADESVRGKSRQMGCGCHPRYHVKVMDREALIARLSGCYVTLPTLFLDGDLELNLPAMRRHVRFLLENGLDGDNAVFLAGGAAGDFSTMTFEERVRVTETVVEETDGKVAVVMGAQTTSTRELVELARAAERAKAAFIQVSPPFYFTHTEDDLYDFFLAGAEAANVSLVVYNTHWSSANVSLGLIDKLTQIPNIIGLKWSSPWGLDMTFERVLLNFAKHFCVIDNHLQFTASHMLGARGAEFHIPNFWPAWSARFWQLLETGHYVEAQHEFGRVIVPFHAFWGEMESFTGGDGYLDKLCIELIGLASSRCRPPTRDVRDKYRDQVRRMLLTFGVPGVSRD